MRGLIGIGYDWCWTHSFIRNGWPVTRLGPNSGIDGQESYVGMLPVSETHLAAVRAATGILHPVLRLPPSVTPQQVVNR